MARWQGFYDELARERYASLLSYAMALTGQRATAEDLVQEAMVRTFSSPRRLSSAQHAEHYVRRAIASIFIDDARRAKVFRRTAGRFAAGEVTADSADALASRDAVMAALGTLPPQVRACVLLRYYDDLSIAQISHSLKIAEGSVKRYLHDGAVTLRGILAADHDDASELISVHAITHRGRN